MFKTAFVNTKNYVASHKTELTVVALAITVIALQQAGIKQHNEFLKEHELYETYYTPEED